MSLEEWWFAKSAEILSPLFVQRIDKFSFYFSTFVFSVSPPLFFFHVICPTAWFRIFLILNCSTMLIDSLHFLLQAQFEFKFYQSFNAFIRVMRMCFADFLIRGAYGGLINYFKKCERWKRVFYVLAYELNANVIISLHYFRCFFTIVFFVHLSKILISATELKKMLNQ